MKYTIDDLRKIMKTLRGENGCPWDKAQTHDSIKKSMIEESYEVIEALDNKDDKMFANELGDLLLQVIFHSQIADERGAFSFDDVVNEICEKLISRHTHIFGNDVSSNDEEALKIWEKNKKLEKNLTSYTAAMNDVPKNFPALMRAEKVQKKAKSAGFDFPDFNSCKNKVKEELDEVVSAYESGNQKNIDEELGDLLFSVVNLARFIKSDSELSLFYATEKFIKRFEKMENTAKNDGFELDNLTLEELDKYWNKIKAEK